MAEIIKFQIPEPEVTSDSDYSGRGSKVGAQVPIVSVHSDEESSQTGRISTEDLYPLRSEMRPELATIFTLLEEGIQIISEAIEAIEEHDTIASDDAIQRFQALLPELFCCRNLGDGFGAVINGIFHCLSNLHGEPLNLKQLQILKQLVNKIYTEPFLEFNEAVDEIITLEKIGFEIEPKYFAFVGELLNE